MTNDFAKKKKKKKSEPTGKMLKAYRVHHKEK